MIVRLKDSLKLFGVMIMCACAALPSALFMNSNKDIMHIKDLITTAQDMAIYDANVAMGNIIIAVSGGVLSITTVIMLLFYIKNYIDTHKSELGILKALGYSNFKIAREFWVFGLSVFLGTCIGFGIAFSMMPSFYKEMFGNESWILPDVPMNFNLELILFIIILPSLVFGILSTLYGYFKLKQPVLELIGGKMTTKVRKVKLGEKNLPFLKYLKKSTVKSRPSLVFFIGFASFCYADMVQMSLTMDAVGGSDMMGILIFVIGIVLAFISLYIAVTTVVNGNSKTIAMLKVFGYSERECSNSVLNGYRFPSIVGFIIGTLYQYVFMKMMINSFYTEETAGFSVEYNFDFESFIITLVSFVIVYELMMWTYSMRIKRISLKEVMIEE